MRWPWQREKKPDAVEVVGELRTFEVKVKGSSHPELYEARTAYVGGAGELVFTGTYSSYTEQVMTLAAGQWERYVEVAA